MSASIYFLILFALAFVDLVATKVQFGSHKMLCIFLHMLYNNRVAEQVFESLVFNAFPSVERNE